jgi:hypothetical protein
MVSEMGREVLTVLVPAAAEVLLLALCLSVWLRLRRLGLGGVCELTLAALVVDGIGQGWQLWLRLGRPAGVAWLAHLMVCALMLYVVYRLGELPAQVRGLCLPAELAKSEGSKEEEAEASG